MATPTFTKFRELSSNKVQFILTGHQPAQPHTLTASSALPVPRKGNPGTLKTTLNLHQSVVLDKGAQSERVVPIVVKMETSFPVGTTEADQVKAIETMRLLMNDAITSDGPIHMLATVGILPEAIVHLA